MRTAMVMLLAFCLDLVMGDPRWLPHPVREMGRAISALEKGLRGLFPATPGGERAAGAVLALVLPVGSFWLGWAVLWLCGRLAPWLGLAAEVLLCSQCLAARELKKESMAVYRELERGDLSAARTAVARIVGRDTGSLTAEGVTKAAVETVAENTSDGEIAPLFWMAIGGAPLALAYKAVNTMDSMVGYRNERYRYFGTAAARLDDLVNWLPARMAALVMVALCPLAGLDAEGAFRVWRRDRKKHKSPNSAQTEAAMAGALGVQLAGDAWYFGELHHKPTLGDDLRPVRPADIKKADQLMYWTSGAFLLLAAWGRMAVSLL
jgi:adenosylcobinamide-phosphate synthase